MYGSSQDKGLLDLLPVLINVLSKDYQPGIQGASNGQPQDKGIFDLLPVLINVLTKGYQPGMQASPGMSPQDKGLFDLLPVIIGALTKGYQPAAPAATASEQEKFLPFLIPVLTAAVPAIINAVSKDYQPSVQPNGAVGPADQEKFLNILIPVLTSAVPAIINAVTKGYQPGMTSTPGATSQDKGSPARAHQCSDEGLSARHASILRHAIAGQRPDRPAARAPWCSDQGPTASSQYGYGGVDDSLSGHEPLPKRE
jgi:hypothetical protein